MTRRRIVSLCLVLSLATAAPAAADGDQPQRLKVLTFTNDVNDLALAGNRAWFATAGVTWRFR